MVLIFTTAALLVTLVQYDPSPSTPELLGCPSPKHEVHSFVVKTAITVRHTWLPIAVISLDVLASGPERRPFYLWHSTGPRSLGSLSLLHLPDDILLSLLSPRHEHISRWALLRSLLDRGHRLRDRPGRVDAIVRQQYCLRCHRNRNDNDGSGSVARLRCGSWIGLFAQLPSGVFSENVAVGLRVRGRGKRPSQVARLDAVSQRHVRYACDYQLIAPFSSCRPCNAIAHKLPNGRNSIERQVYHCALLFFTLSSREGYAVRIHVRFAIFFCFVLML